MSACLQEKWHGQTTADEYDDPTASERESPRKVDPSSVRDVGPGEFRFGHWCLVPAARLLLHKGRPVELGSRAFDLLHLLSSHRGSVIDKRAIVSFVWPNTIVEESNLRFQMAALRKALGADGTLIKTIPGRGYILVEEYSAGLAGRPPSYPSRSPSRELTQLQVVGRS
jgi:DNA-binding winged helix-turn-helix (wHTH) protein